MDGWVFLDKPKNITSFKVIQRLRKILQIKKIGHAGTLDPFATGILPIAVGEATKSIHYLNQNKVYEFNVVFGELKDTCLLYTSPSPRDRQKSRMPSSA